MINAIDIWMRKECILFISAVKKWIYLSSSQASGLNRPPPIPSPKLIGSRETGNVGAFLNPASCEHH